MMIAWGNTAVIITATNVRRWNSRDRGFEVSQQAATPTRPLTIISGASATAKGENHQKPHTSIPPVRTASHTRVHPPRSTMWSVAVSAVDAASAVTGCAEGGDSEASV